MTRASLHLFDYFRVSTSDRRISHPFPLVCPLEQQILPTLSVLDVLPLSTLVQPHLSAESRVERHRILRTQARGFL